MGPMANDHRATDFDAIVIGAGHNGLVCAAYLARGGLRTLLVEARDSVGGTAASEPFAGGTVNICNCDHITFRTTPVIDELGLADHGLRYVDMEPATINMTWGDERAWSQLPRRRADDREPGAHPSRPRSTATGSTSRLRCRRCG